MFHYRIHHQMNPSVMTFKPNHKKSYPIQTDQLTKFEAKIFQELLCEWTDTPTLDLILGNWTIHRDKTLSMMNTQQDLSLLLLNVSSLNRYLADVFNLMNTTASPIVVLNGTHHDANTVKRFKAHFFNYNIFSMRGSNIFGGVLIGVHKSIRSHRVTKFDNVCNLLVLEIGTVSEMFQLVTCYSPPTENLPLDIFDRLLQLNPNTIFTGDFNAKHRSRSRSIENQKGRLLFNWLSSTQTHSSLEIINKFTPTSTRSNATIDLIIVPSHMLTTSFSVLPSVGNDHYPVICYPSFKLSSTHLLHPIKRTHWKIFEIFLTFTATFWQSLAASMSNSAAFFTLYERFLSLCVSRLTFITFRKAIKPSLPQHLVELIEQKRHCLKLFRQTRHPFFAVALRDFTKVIHKQLFTHKRTSWLNYCSSLNDCDTKSFWMKAKRHFNSRAAPIDGFLDNNNIVSSPTDMCTMARRFYEDQFSSHPDS